MTIVPHIYDNDNLIFQLDEDTWFGDYFVPKGYVNITQICQAGGKRVWNYLRLKDTQGYIDYLEKQHQTSMLTSEYRPEVYNYQPVIVIEGGIPEHQGTWACMEIAIEVASWVSYEFRHWANQTLWYVLSDDYKPDDDRMVELKDVGLRHWKRLRRETKALFRPMTDEFQNYWYEVGFKPEPHHYASLVDLINTLLFGLSAREIRQSEGILERSQLTRDNFGEEALDRIAYMEKLICGLMKTEGIAPELAIYKAYDIMNVGAIDYWC